LAGVGFYVVHLAIVGGLDVWIDSFAWLSGYSSSEPLLTPEVLVDRYITLFSGRIAEVFTLSLIVACSIGIYKSRLLQGTDRFRAFMTLCVISLGLGMLATLYERKLFNYHFLKSLWAFAPLAALGVIEIGRQFTSAWNISHSIIRKLLLTATVCLFLFYSPVLSLIRQPLRWAYYKISGTNVGEVIETTHGSYPLAEMQTVSAQLLPELRPEDEVFFWGNHVGMYSMLHRLPTTICLTNTPLASPWTPPVWKATFYRQLLARPTQYIIIEKGDPFSYITGSTDDSRSRFFQDSTLSTMLQRYSLFKESRHFDVYRIKSAN
jgi:hypothetical protein